MADGTTPITSLKGKVSDAEWQARVDLAALYRLVALHGWDDMIFTHISARIPGPEHHFLINPYGMFFGEMTASCLVKVDLEGNVIDKTPYFINPAGFTIHSAIHAAREDAQFVMHLHSDQGTAVSAHAEGLLPLTQHSLIVLPQLAYHDYEGIALNLDERERLVADLGDQEADDAAQPRHAVGGRSGGRVLVGDVLPGASVRAAGDGSVDWSRQRAPRAGRRRRPRCASRPAWAWA
jgi:ribulose-5-phosphate 4-epimerase/fuculose-1-phosphate aldolase